jgi:large subunit ribosomal protein L17
MPTRRIHPDDLTIVEGIGPKIAGLLRAAGIQTLAELGVTDVARLSEILTAAKLQFSDPTTWPEQASLAAAGKFDELEALQTSLKGGRHT